MRLRIVNKRRFIVSTTITLILLGIIIYAMFSLIVNNVKSNLDEYQTVAIKVQAGDNLWSIANKYNDGSIDIRTHIDYIRYINNLDNRDHIVVGQKLLIPTTNNNELVLK